MGERRLSLAWGGVLTVVAACSSSSSSSSAPACCQIAAMGTVTPGGCLCAGTYELGDAGVSATVTVSASNGGCTAQTSVTFNGSTVSSTAMGQPCSQSTLDGGH
jgi:hypothetical protein